MSKDAEAEFTKEEIEIAEKQIDEQQRKIDYYITEYSIELLAKKMRDGDFEIPSYQREDTWDQERKSNFIESLLMGLPVPFLFFWENPSTGKLEILDGSQRLRTIQQFIDGDLILNELEKLDLASYFSFNDLTEARQRKFKNRSIRGIVLNDRADEDARFHLFYRINTGSKIANSAEIRRGALRGGFSQLVIELAKDEAFIKLAPVSEKQLKEREREELVIRFFAYGDGLDAYADEVSAFLLAYNKSMDNDFEKNPALVDAYRERFEKTMSFISKAFPYGFRKTEKSRATPRARFEAIAVGSYLALKVRPDLIPDPEKNLNYVQGKVFNKIAGSDGANVTKKLEKRINSIRKLLLGK